MKSLQDDTVKWKDGCSEYYSKTTMYGQIYGDGGLGKDNRNVLIWNLHHAYTHYPFNLKV